MNSDRISISLLLDVRAELEQFLPPEWRHCIVIGAFANQLWLDYNDRSGYRGTRDIDLVLGQIALGREIRAVFASNTPLTSRLDEIMVELIDDRLAGLGQIQKSLGEESGGPGDAQAVLTRLLQGFRQGRKK